MDIWALGCIFYYLATLEHPFKDATLETLAFLIIENDPKPIREPYSPQIINFINLLLEKNAEKRPPIHQIYKKLRDRNEQKIVNRVSIFNLRQILSLKTQLKQERKKQETIA